MKQSKIKEYFLSLPSEAQDNFLSELHDLKDISNYNLLEKRVIQLDNKQGVCPHCGV